MCCALEIEGGTHEVRPYEEALSYKIVLSATRSYSSTRKLSRR